MAGSTRAPWACRPRAGAGRLAVVESSQDEGVVTEPKQPVVDPASATDVVLVHGVTPDGEGLEVIRHRNDRFEAGALRTVREGQPIHGELVRLKPRAQCPLVCDVEVTLPAPTPVPRTDVAARGPAQVASDRYRANWDTIWSRPRDPDACN
jgi:hypothetical protein